jgi:hypothetical protein
MWLNDLAHFARVRRHLPVEGGAWSAKAIVQSTIASHLI